MRYLPVTAAGSIGQKIVNEKPGPLSEGPAKVTGVGFMVDTTRRGSRIVVRIRGEIDLLTAPHLRQTLTRVIREQSPHLVIDLTGVGLCGSTGLTVLQAAKRWAAERGGSVALAAPRPTVRKVLTVSGFTKLLPVYDDLDAALSEGRLN